jgi:hypothetical protein
MRVRAALIVPFLALAESPALAADPPAKVADAAAPAATSPAARAQRAADEAYEAYQAGDFKRALSLYAECYRLSPTADALFDIATLYDAKLHDPRMAIEYYRRYQASLDAAPDLVARATTRIAELTQELNQPATPQPAPKAPPPAQAAPPAHETASSGDRFWTYFGFALAGAGVVTGAVTGTVSILKANEVKRDCPSRQACDPSLQPSVDESKALGTVSTVAFAAAAVGVVIGTVSLLTSRSSAEAPPKAAEGAWLGVDVGLGSVGLRGAF